jgi:hypothetical protein
MVFLIMLAAMKTGNCLQQGKVGLENHVLYPLRKECYTIPLSHVMTFDIPTR